MKTIKSPFSAAFSLLEVLVAMAIISIGLLALSTTGARQLKQLSDLQQQTLAHWVAQSVITESRLSKTAGLGQSQGVSKMGNQEWYWQLYTAPGSDPYILRLDASVYLDPGFQQLVVAESGFKLRARP